MFLKGRFNKYFIPILFFFLTFIIYYISSGNSTPYNYFVYLADAFLHGRLYLTVNPEHLNELIPIDGKYYVIYPPMPAILLIIPVFLKGLSFDQTIASIFIGSLNSVLVYLLFKKIFSGNKKKISLSLWITFLFIFGTIHWYLSTMGTAWYFAQITAIFFLLLALNETFGKKNPFIIGIFLGAAYWSRLPVILSFPFFLIMLTEKQETIKKFFITNYKTILYFFAGLSIFVLLNFIYNYLRFETIFDVAYYLQPGVMNEPWFSQGYFNIAYIPSHLEILFLKLPIFISEFPYIIPSWIGLAIWITTPIFLFALKAPKDKLTIACWSAIIPIAILVMSHGGTGAQQFGYRYAMDFYLFLLIMTATTISNIKWYHKILIIIGIIINLWGVLWIEKFNWVGW